MQAFGLTINKTTAPLIYLAFSIPSFLLIWEACDMLQYPIAARVISVFIELGFILLTVPVIYQYKTIKIPSKAVFLIIFWLVWTLASTLLGNQPWAAMMRWFELLSSITTAFCLYLLISTRPDYIELIVKAIIAALIICILAFTIIWNISPNPVKHDWVSNIPLFVNIRHFGYIPAIALPLGYWLLEKNTVQNNSHYGAVTYLTICWALVFWLGGRGTFLAVSCVTILYCILSKQQIKWVITSILFGLIISQLFIVDAASLSLFRIFDLFINTEGRELNAVSSFRMIIYTEALGYWWNTSPIFGLGADGFYFIVPAIGGIDAVAHPHSIFIQLLFSFGIPGLLLPGYLFILLSIKIIKSKDRSAKAFYLSLISILVLSIFDGILYHAYGLFLSTIIAAICLSLAWPQNKKISNKNSPNKDAFNQGAFNQNAINNKQNLITSSWLILIIAISAVYYAAFINQLYQSKYSCVDEDWINWNAKYPLYFSPSPYYKRYSPLDIERLKEEFVSNQQAIGCTPKLSASKK